MIRGMNRYKVVSLTILLVGAAGLLLPYVSIAASTVNRVDFSAGYFDVMSLAFSSGSGLFSLLGSAFLLCFAAVVILTLMGFQSRVLGIVTALTLAVFIIGFFPNIHKSKPVMGMGFGIGFFLMLASLLFYTLNAHLKKKDDYDAIIRDFRMNKLILLIGILVAVFYFIFCYIPMYGIIIGFKDFSALKGILASEWVGFRHLENFFTGIYFNRTVKNTLILNIYQLIFGFPAPILLALLLNEIKVKAFKRTVQTITYLPHFVSLVVICGIVVDFFSLNGLFNDLISLFGLERSMFLQDPNAYRPIYVGSGIWASIGWGSIIYLAALSGINQELYEAVAIEGAGRFRQFIHVTLPGITPMIVIMFILQIGSLMSEGADKAILLANPLTWETSDIISFYTYRRGLVEGDFSYSAAVGLFNTAINLVLLVSANSISRRVGETSLW